ncbi:uncharacterized protein LOC125457933 isoform X2 [Stegostoma tigrinum]|uniref:uncharacterized protein LOC125457933 isoform X2 n=1 Tax=Stegostoma tigrinum TaxID=3053191 RepID=UPI00202AD954|nr:uncharacterized protein LOC125457933 isoform X2 [Stegostoma tigrinum]
MVSINSETITSRQLLLALYKREQNGYSRERFRFYWFAYPPWLYEEDCTRSQATERAQGVRFQADMTRLWTERKTPSGTPALSARRGVSSSGTCQLPQPGLRPFVPSPSDSSADSTETCQMEEQQRKRGAQNSTISMSSKWVCQKTGGKRRGELLLEDLLWLTESNGQESFACTCLSRLFSRQATADHDHLLHYAPLLVAQDRDSQS